MVFDWLEVCSRTAFTRRDVVSVFHKDIAPKTAHASARTPAAQPLDFDATWRR